ncbi:hypothetical protein D3C73_1236750 [compost metagenome]
MLAAKPVVASYNGYPSMLNESGCGVFVPAANVDAVVAAVHQFKSMSADQRTLIGHKGRQWLLENRRYSKLAQDYLSILF